MTFWHDRWKNQLTGWHRAEYNDLMVKHWPSLNAPDHSEVLVPLCGKSLDMLGWQNKVTQSWGWIWLSKRFKLSSQKINSHLKAPNSAN